VFSEPMVRVCPVDGYSPVFVSSIAKEKKYLHLARVFYNFEVQSYYRQIVFQFTLDVPLLPTKGGFPSTTYVEPAIANGAQRN
jgi:hypothetical protein